MARTATRAISFLSSTPSRGLSTAMATVTASKDKESSLYRRLSALGGSEASVVDTLNEWVKEGKSVKRVEIIGYVNQLRKYKKYKHALQLLKWMEKRGRDLTHGDQAIRLDLLSKVEGIASAEKYFDSLKESAKNKLTYGALLNCYCKEKMVDKAMSLFEKMKKLSVASTSLAYNNLMALNMRMSYPKKVAPLVEEMKKNQIVPDIVTYNLLMNSYAYLHNIKGVERVVEEMNTNGIRFDWATHANLATIYVKAGLFDKAKSALEELEKVANLHDREAFHVLICLYARMSNLEGVNRVWQSLKSAFPKVTNASYLVMLKALCTMGYRDTANECFKEWESVCSTYDIRLANILIDSYLSQFMIKEAELLCESAVQKGAKPNFRTLEMFMNYHLMKQQMDLALDYLKTAASKAKVERNKWQPSQETVSVFLKYFESKNDVGGAEELCDSLKKLRCLNSEAYSSLLRTYIAIGKTDPEMRKRMSADGIEMNSDINKLLEKVCPK
ncbi:PREDICTED: pentatricopeptide repeat-containing protein At1g60770-like [Nelumbo nucifera]|uniref:Pentatricopeptide repeat-containing protein At1g60770 n=2 Tax=Nelumbo nucifera TaxID=4432 RepID=A0A822YP79_NELNU|nr:PREDICTED: pentatricopeptide repeat-containing protein At1g60770-like [Nelumbo nucifera]DAD35994.1 TPA_asm: hypothetical protein HUJ06_006634 [Nelumbo nucifera]